MKAFIDAYLDLNKEERKKGPEDRLLKLMLEQFKEDDWIEHWSENDCHWLKFTSNQLNTLALSEEPELAQLVETLQESQFKDYIHCSRCGQVVFNYSGHTYRDNGGCVGRSYECDECQNLSNKAVAEISEVTKRFGTGAAVHHFLHNHRKAPDCEVVALLTNNDNTCENQVLEKIAAIYPEVVQSTEYGDVFHFNSTLLDRIMFTDSVLEDFKRNLVYGGFEKHPRCAGCGQVLFNYEGIRLRKEGNNLKRQHECLDCQQFSERKLSLTCFHHQEHGVVGTKAHELADKEIEKCREIEVLAPWTPIFFDSEATGFIMGNDKDLIPGTVFDGNEIDLNYYVIYAGSLEEAQKTEISERHNITFLWSDVVPNSDWLPTITETELEIKLHSPRY